MEATPLVVEVRAGSEVGRGFVGVAERVGLELAAGMVERDRAGVFDLSVVALLRESGVASCTVVPELGGGGVSSVLDLAAVVDRLARGDASAAIAANMHLAACRGFGGNPALAPVLAGVAGGSVWISAAVTEGGTNFFHPRATLAVSADGPASLSGTKILSTGCPAATHFVTQAVIRGGPDDGRRATLVIPADLAGIDVDGTWTGIGMRASASGTVRFDDVAIGPDVPVMVGGPEGEWEAGAVFGRAVANIGNLAAMVGTAEGAAMGLADVVRPKASAHQTLGELTTHLTTAVVMLADVARRADDLIAAGGPAHLADAHRFMASFQAAKVTIHRSTIAAVELAMELAGGSTYVESHPLNVRLRDVRAGPFMEPFRPYEATAYLGAIASGTTPDITA